MSCHIIHELLYPVTTDFSTVVSPDWYPMISLKSLSPEAAPFHVFSHHYRCQGQPAAGGPGFGQSGRDLGRTCVLVQVGARNFSAAADWCLQQVTPVSWWSTSHELEKWLFRKRWNFFKITILELREYPTIFFFLFNIFEKFQILIYAKKDDTPGRSFVFGWFHSVSSMISYPSQMWNVTHMNPRTSTSQWRHVTPSSFDEAAESSLPGLPGKGRVV